MTTSVATIVTRSRLHLARALMQSVADAFPEARRHVLVVDPPDGLFDPATEPFAVTIARDLRIPAFESHAFVNDALGICCLLKPFFAAHLLQQNDTDVVIYADADMLLHSRPDAVLEMMTRHSVLLTPHVLAPLGPSAPRTDGDIMRSGAFNAGFFCVRRSVEGSRFLAWWSAVLQRERRLDATFCHDQQFLGLTAVYFPWIGVCRDPGCNVAYWNLSERPLARDAAGQLTAAGQPVSFFHYSFFDSATPDLLVNRPPLVIPAQSAVLRELLNAYAARLRDCGLATCLRWPFTYASFLDGKRITPAHRDYYLQRVWDAPESTGSPFDPSFQCRGCRGLKSLYAVDHPLPRLLRWARRLRPRAGA